MINQPMIDLSTPTTNICSMSMSHHAKPHFIFLHGWGQSQQVWHQQALCFSHHHAINLPGHGNVGHLPKEQWVSSLASQINALSKDQYIILVGWSLGGQLAIQLEKECSIQGLVLVSSTPRFRQHQDWEHGCSQDIWQGFCLAAAQQNPRFMQRFFHIMLHGDNLSRSQCNQVAKGATHPQFKPSQQGLQAGLHLLSELDLREDIRHITTPTLVVHGQQDAIVPAQAGAFLARHINNCQQHIFQECGHAPFLTHHIAFNQLLEQWWKNISM